MSTLIRTYNTLAVPIILIVFIAFIIYLFCKVFELNDKIKHLFSMIDMIRDSLKSQNSFDNTISEAIDSITKNQNIFDSQLIEHINKNYEELSERIDNITKGQNAFDTKLVNIINNNYRELNERIDDVIKHTQTEPVRSSREDA